VKQAAWDNPALLTALGWQKTPITGKAVIKETMKEAVQDHGCIPVTIEYVDTDGLGNDKIYTTKTVIAFDKDPQTFKGEVLAGKYHGTLDIVGANIGWSNYPV
jgi:hypothetical protein